MALTPHALGTLEDDDMWAQVRPEAARRLLLAALDSFAARGFRSTTTRDPAHFRAVAELRRTGERSFRDLIGWGVDTGEFVVSDVPGVALAVMSLGIDLARWYGPGADRTPGQLADLYADLALRMVGQPDQAGNRRLERVSRAACS